MNRRIQWVLSAWIVFHLAAVAMVPHSGHYLKTRLSPVMLPYLEMLGLAVPWRFFAPEPGPAPTYVDYELLNSAGEQIRRGEFPEHPDPYILRDRQNRRIGLTTFLVIQSSRIDTVLSAWFCREPGVHSVRLWRVVYPVAPIQAISSGKQKVDDRSNPSRDWVAHSFCADQNKPSGGGS